MGQIKKVGDVYFIEFYARGLLYSKIGGADLASAEKLLQETEAAIAAGEALTASREIEWSVFFEQFMCWAPGEFGERSTVRFGAAMGHFSCYVRGLTPPPRYLSQLTPRVFEGYKASISATHKPALVNFSILLLREMMEYGIRLGHINDNPTLHIRLLPARPRVYAATARYNTARTLLGQEVPMGKVYKLLALGDIARICYFVNLMPASRGDMYN